MAATADDSSNGLSSPDVTRPRVLIVSRRCVRKNKFVDFVGEYHLDLLVGYGAAPVIVPRVGGVDALLSSFEPVHGVLLCEGEDIDPSHYTSNTGCTLTPDEIEGVRRAHASDAAVDASKDAIELRLARLCLARGAPFLGICRGSQVLNVASGGTLYTDVETELQSREGARAVTHIDYGNYDGHRHVVSVVGGTPLARWFEGQWEDGRRDMIMVNSYHHQGVRRLAQRFVPMAYSEDGLVEGFYDPDMYCPEEGKFVVGLQFHPERMRKPGSDEFDYPGCPAAYQEFVKAVAAYKRKLDSTMAPVPRGIELTLDVDKKRKVIVRSFPLTKTVSGFGKAGSHAHNLEEGPPASLILESDNTVLESLQERRLKQIGATVRNARSYLMRLKMIQEREHLARSRMAKMSVQQLSELHCFYRMMTTVCSEVLEGKIVQPISLDNDVI